MDKVLPRRTLRRHRVPSGTGPHSIRVNDQFRWCFVWKDGNARDVEKMRVERSFVFTNLKTGHRLDTVIRFVIEQGMPEPGNVSWRLAWANHCKTENL